MKIINVSLSFADHGCLCAWLSLEGAGWGVGFGGVCLGHGYLGAPPSEFTASSKGLVAIMRMVDTVGVER